LCPLAPPGKADLTQPSRPGLREKHEAPEGLGTARFTKPLEWKKRPTRRLWALVQLHPPNPPPRPAAGSRITRGKHTRNPSSRPTSKTLCPALTCVTRATAELPSCILHFTGSAARSYERDQRRNKCNPVVALSALVTNMQSMAIFGALRCRPVCALPAVRTGTGPICKGCCGYKVAWIERVLLPHWDFAFRASRPPIELATCGF
jgi:hypothetical protein